ncbi:t-SNARE [Coemansia reversa NRRL 1564]|uniref:t-SNARE n=1 Tax=Coemansia reversa (strain ATCC 12441 / NRRL 1564) TaxID=763665 RepID=A0A2G5B0V2_COERN|nr:t-SNARE [Coemansia reversa NRRL 1564]|eukprot:PIA12643.1 t-SNARE [Coemansia reversa NRRL 1564]
MEKYLVILNGIERDIETAGGDVDELKTIHEQLLSMADGTRSEAIARQRDQKTAQINNHIVRLRGELNAVGQVNQNTSLSPSEEATRRSRHSVLVRRLMEVLDKYRKIERESQRQYRLRMEKHIRIVMPDATDEEVKEAATNEASRSVYAMDVMSSYRSKEARRMLRDVENRNQDIQDINSTIEESLLNNMFLDLEGMVVQQQDILDNIEQAVESAHENVEAAHTEVKNATWYRIKARKKTWCAIFLLFIIIVAVALGVALPLAIRKGGGSRSSSSDNSKSSFVTETTT